MSESEEFLALYGSLRRGLPDHDALGLADGLSDLGPCRIPGMLIDLGPYPGLVAGIGAVAGEVFAVREPSVLTRLDAFEGYDAGDRIGSRYLRCAVRLLEPPVTAWVYVYNQPVDGLPVVQSGDWLAHQQSRNAG